MLTKISIKPYFKAVSHLHQTTLMETYGNVVELSDTRPNVLIGPNGSGKSAFLRVLSLLTLSNYFGITRLSDKYVNWNDGLWDKEGEWYSKEYRYLHGLTLEGKPNPTLYYHPGFIPGEESNLTHAMMLGFDDEARLVGTLTNKKSSGQAATNLLTHLLDSLEDFAPCEPYHKSWRYPTRSKDFKPEKTYTGEMQSKAVALVKHFENFDQDNRLIILDEREQSLDVYGQALLWKRLSQIKCDKTQVIIASHSVYPIIDSHRFNIIETVPGYIDKVRAVL